LLWRDYFKFILKRYGNRLLGATGVKGRKIRFKDDQVLFEKWVQGQTGIPFIDANMRELQATGFMSNRGRQNAASFLVHDLKINWTWGASYFESKLIDYDLAVNWGNWNYLAGVGNDPRENRYFNIINQALRYDSRGDYVRHWIPELAQIMGKEIHYPTRLESQKFPGSTLSTKYPEPLVDFSKWI
jgi:deoxyribodipyrimidine photo-lyase